MNNFIETTDKIKYKEFYQKVISDNRNLFINEGIKIKTDFEPVYFKVSSTADEFLFTMFAPFNTFTFNECKRVKDDDYEVFCDFLDKCWFIVENIDRLKRMKKKRVKNEK